MSACLHACLNSCFCLFAFVFVCVCLRICHVLEFCNYACFRCNEIKQSPSGLVLMLCLGFWWNACMHACLSASVCACICLHVRLSVCLYVSLSVCLCRLVCLHVCVFCQSKFGTGALRPSIEQDIKKLSTANQLNCSVTRFVAANDWAWHATITPHHIRFSQTTTPSIQQVSNTAPTIVDNKHKLNLPHPQ